MGLGEKEEKPFWAKFLRSDYLEPDDGPLLPKVMDVFDGKIEVDEVVESRALALIEEPVEERPMPQTPQPSGGKDMTKEWEKIRKLEQRLGAANKAHVAMKGKINDHKMKLEAQLSKA